LPFFDCLLLFSQENLCLTTGLDENSKTVLVGTGVFSGVKIISWQLAAPREHWSEFDIEHRP